MILGHLNVSRVSRGFTLVELLIALVVTALLATLAFTLSTQLMAFESWSSDKIAIRDEARLILQRLATDISDAVIREDGQCWFAATVLDRTDNSHLWLTSSLEKPAGAAGGSLNLSAILPSEARYGKSGVWLRFFTSRSGINDEMSIERTAQSLSGPVGVAYQIIRRSLRANATHVNPGYYLHRSEIRAARVDARPGTLEAGYNLDPTATDSFYATAAETNDGTQSGDPISVLSPNSSEDAFGENVVDFGVRLFARDVAGELRLIFPRSAADLSHLGRSFDPSNSSIQYPESVDVSLRILTPEGARQIALLESGQLGTRPRRFVDDSSWWWGIAEANSLWVSQRFTIGAKPI